MNAPHLFSLDTPLIDFGYKKTDSKIEWTTRDAVEGVQIFGGIGSGKTSGSGRLIALKYLQNGFGGLVLTVKPDEKALWESYCKEAGRLNDLVVIEPGGPYNFNFLEYESAQQIEHSSITDNLLQVLKTVIKAGEEKDSGKSDDPFWENSLDMLIFNLLDLCLLAYKKVTVQSMYDIVTSLPKKEEVLDPDGKSHFMQALRLANENVAPKVKEWLRTQAPEEIDRLTKDKELLEWTAQMHVPDARTLGFVEIYFLQNFKTLSEKTRSIIELSFSSFLFRLMKEPVYSLFCNKPSNILPEDCMQGKIILVNLPVKQFHKIGRDCQILFKYIWQRSMEKRNVGEHPRPVFLWADEAQNFIHEHDTDFQATARSSRIATVYITQNLPNYLSNMGGHRSESRVKSFLGTLATKIFHANADIDTNEYASKLFGERYSEDLSRSVGTGKDSISRTIGYSLERVARPDVFPALATGGPNNNHTVEGYVHKQGWPLLANPGNYKIKFPQKN